MDCSHTVTKGRADEPGIWCIRCGQKIFEVEARPCRYCAYFRSDTYGGWCHQKLMAVIPGGRVVYKISEGTCFTQ